MAAQDDKPGIAGVEVHANEQEALASHCRQVRRALELSGTSPRMGTMVRKSVELEAIKSSDKAGCAAMEEPDHLSCVSDVAWRGSPEATFAGTCWQGDCSMEESLAVAGMGDMVRRAR